MVELMESRIVSPLKDEKILEVHEALTTLAKKDRVKAEIVKLRFFVGLKNKEIAEALDMSESTVRRQWELCKVMLYKSISDLKQTPPPSSSP